MTVECSKTPTTGSRQPFQPHLIYTLYLYQEPKKMQFVSIKIIIVFLLTTNFIGAQFNAATHLPSGELTMTFPSIYFQHHSTQFANMPYTVDSCLKYIASHFNKNINSLVIWRDSTESEKITNARIKKLKPELKKYIRDGKFEIVSMNDAQKISQHRIQNALNKTETDYFITLNNCFDFSKTKIPNNTQQSHIIRPKIWCKDCWKHGFHMDKKSRTLRKIARKNKSEKSKNRRRLVWTGWKTGFHWSTPKNK